MGDARLRATLGLPACDGCTPGSNNWVIAGTHTASGKPLLSNDMHLGLTVPNIWYMADLSAPGFHAAGVTLPGMPFVIAGHNEHVAWGFTALYADVQDLYIEKLDGKGNYQAATEAGSRSPSTTKSIHVRGGKDVALDVQSTEHGPLLDPIFTKDSRPIALKWTLYDTTLNTMPLYALNTASNWTDFRRRWRSGAGPRRTSSTPTTRATSRYHAVGEIPMRSGGGSSEPIPYDPIRARMGRCMSGRDLHSLRRYAQRLRSAVGISGHRELARDHGQVAISAHAEWADPYRAERIYKCCRGATTLRPQDMLAVQTDIYSEVDQELGHRFAYAIDHAPNADDQLAQSRRPDAQLGWASDHRLRRGFDRDADARRAVAA